MENLMLIVYALLNATLQSYTKSPAYCTTLDFETEVYFPVSESYSKGDTLNAVFDIYLDGYVVTGRKEETVTVILK